MTSVDLAAGTTLDDGSRPAVDLSDVVAVIGGFPVLAGVDLRVERGEIVLFHGPNGAGKTSLLRLCAGLLPLERGTGTILGMDVVEHRDELRRRVGLVAHANGLYQDLTVAENVRFWASMVDADASEVDVALDRMGLRGRLADAPIARCSAGQRRRTALACLVVRRAELWLLDEPHAALDAAARDQLDEIIRAAAASGATVLVASHELERTMALATRHVEVRGGQIVELHDG